MWRPRTIFGALCRATTRWRPRRRLCEALSDLAARKDLNRELMRALLALDQRSRSLRDALLVNYVTRNPQAQAVSSGATGGRRSS